MDSLRRLFLSHFKKEGINKKWVFSISKMRCRCPLRLKYQKMVSFLFYNSITFQRKMGHLCISWSLWHFSCNRGYKSVFALFPSSIFSNKNPRCLLMTQNKTNKKRTHFFLPASSSERLFFPSVVPVSDGCQPILLLLRNQAICLRICPQLLLTEQYMLFQIRHLNLLSVNQRSKNFSKYEILKSIFFVVFRL